MAEYWDGPDTGYSDDAWAEVIYAGLEDAMSIRMQDPIKWLNSTRLMTRLRETYEAWESDGHFADVAAL